MSALRICKVKDTYGYFHDWEHYSRPLEASPLMGGAPAGVFSKIFAIVEFSDGVKRVDPGSVIFVDKINHALTQLVEEKENRDD